MNNFDLDVFDKYYLINFIEEHMIGLIEQKRGSSNNDKIDTQLEIFSKLLYLLKTYNTQESTILTKKENDEEDE
jgi:hypothetical protein